MNFQPRNAIVAASDSGIGRATAVALAEAGLNVGITWHSDSDGAEKTAEEARQHGVQAMVRQLDTSDVPGCADVIDALAEELEAWRCSSTRRVPVNTRPCSSWGSIAGEPP